VAKLDKARFRRNDRAHSLTYERRNLDLENSRMKRLAQYSAHARTRALRHLAGLALCASLGLIGCHGQKSAESAAMLSPPAAITTREVDYTSGATPLKGFIAYPAGEAKRPGVLIVHEWWGLNEYVRKRAVQLAEQGYVAMAIDMYGDGKHTTHPEEAKAFMTAALSNIEEAKLRFKAAQDLLSSDPRTNPEKLAAIGYCFGGATVLHMARFGDNDLDLIASFHGNLGTQSPMQKGAYTGKIFVAQGGADPFVPPEQVAAFKQEMEAAGASLELIEYPGAKHGFTNPDATEAGQKAGLPLAYDPEADKQSWQHLTELLAQL
jgi:dienelactone hydrolase